MSTVAKISALLAKAEATDNEHEREAFMDKAQQLSMLAQIDLEVARQHQADKTKRETPVKQHILLLDHEVRTLRSHFVDLAYAICRQNNIKMLYYPTSKRLAVNLFGFPSDIEVMQLLFSSLAVQMTAAADAFIKSKAYKGETWIDYDCRCRDCGWWGGSGHTKKVDARVARNQFYDAFVSEVTKRLREARQKVEEAETSTPEGQQSNALVLKSRRDEVVEFYEANTGRVSNASVSRRRHSGGSAGSAGRSAGASARLSSNRGVGSRAGALAS